MKIIVRETRADLPAAGEGLGGGPYEGDIAFTLDNNNAFFWNGTEWRPIGTPTPVTGSGALAATGISLITAVEGRSIYGLQVTGQAVPATAWDVRLEGSVDQLSWTEILSHVTSDGDGEIKFSGGNRYPVEWVRINVNALTLGPAGFIQVSFEAMP